MKLFFEAFKPGSPIRAIKRSSKNSARDETRLSAYSFSTRSMHITAPRINIRSGWSGGTCGVISSM